MTFAAAGVTLKQHRAELIIASLAAVLAAVLGLSIAVQIGALGATTQCLDSVLKSPEGVGVDAECLSLARQGGEILGETYLTGEGTVSVSVMGVLPFLVGLLAGVPIVASEVQARTAQTAWALFSSRSRWLARQIAPVVIVAGAALAFAAAAAVPVAEASVAWGTPASTLVGNHGPTAVLRGLGAFGLGLGTGAVTGRTLPAFVIAAGLSVALLTAVGLAHDRWLGSLPAQPIAAISGDAEPIVDPRTIHVGWRVQTPEGTLISSTEGRQIASGAGVPPADEHDSQDIPALEWYSANGYRLVAVGIPDEVAVGWAAVEGLIFAVVGLTGVAVTMVAVHRARPR